MHDIIRCLALKFAPLRKIVLQRDGLLNEVSNLNKRILELDEQAKNDHKDQKSVLDLYVSSPPLGRQRFGYLIKHDPHIYQDTVLGTPDYLTMIVSVGLRNKATALMASVFLNLARLRAVTLI